MDTTINTFSKFRAYREKRVREFIQKYKNFCCVPWGWILFVGGISVLLLFLAILRYYLEDGKEAVSSHIYLVFILIPILAFTILTGVRYWRSIYIRMVVFGCLRHISCYESRMRRNVERCTLRDKGHLNEREMYRLIIMNNNLELRCELIDRLIRMKRCNIFIRTIFTLSLDKYKRKKKNREFLLQERCSYRQLQNRYLNDILLLWLENRDLNDRMEELGEIENGINQVLDEILIVIDNYRRCLSGIQREEIRAFFTDLVEVVSHIKQ